MVLVLGDAISDITWQGVMFVCELSTGWYETYKALEEMADDLGGILLEGPGDGGDEDER